MFVMICYDIADDRRRYDVSRELENFGERVQYSVFECHLEEAQLEELKDRLARAIDEEQDRVRYYRLCPKDVGGIAVDGQSTISRDLDYHII